MRAGFAAATREILMILDADLTVPPEDLPKFYRARVSGICEFVNGTRLVYPMEAQAMRFANMVGNKFFALAFSFLLGQPIQGHALRDQGDRPRVLPSGWPTAAPTSATSIRSATSTCCSAPSGWA